MNDNNSLLLQSPPTYEQPILKTMPLREQPAYRVTQDATACNQTELLAALIGGQKQIEIAQDLLAHFGDDIRRIYQAHPQELAKVKGSAIHDEIFHKAGKGFFRNTNNAGGIEGGMTNGDPIVLRAALKPLASLRKPLKSVNIGTKEEMTADIVRSDVCPVASAAVIGEAVTAVVLAQATQEKFGGDSVREMADNLTRYKEHILKY